MTDAHRLVDKLELEWAREEALSVREFRDCRPTRALALDALRTVLQICDDAELEDWALDGAVHGPTLRNAIQGKLLDGLREDEEG